MEVNNNVVDLKKKVKGEEVMVFTPPELAMVRNVVNQSSNNQGHSIKDFRMIDNLLKKVDSLLPEPPNPQMPKPADGKQYTKEEIESNTKLAKEFSDQLTEFASRKLEVTFNSSELMVVKQRLNSFNGFVNDPENRKRVLNLAEKFGV
jgi:hypothetical protein